MNAIAPDEYGFPDEVPNSVDIGIAVIADDVLVRVRAIPSGQGTCA